MNLAAFLSLMDEDLRPQNSKIHLASWNGTEDPLDVYRAGRFEEWQAWQSKQNFGRESVVSLIRMPGKDRWLYAGSFVVAGCRWDPAEEMYKYALERRAKCTEFAGQLVVTFSRPGRQSYLNMESWASTIMVAEILPQRLSTGPFPGFKDVNISKVELDRIVEQHSESWHAALSSVAGVYLITETITDKLYVGSATGAGARAGAGTAGVVVGSLAEHVWAVAVAAAVAAGHGLGG